MPASRTRLNVRSSVLAAALAALLMEPAAAAGVEDFYKGKSVSLIIGYSVGGGYDLYGRLLARHMAQYIPGRPTIVPQNLTGAGSLRAANFLYSAAPRDGTVLGTFGRTIATTPLLAPAGAQFDATRFTWLGSITNEVSLCVTWHSSPVKTWKDSLEKEVVMGGEGSGAVPTPMSTRCCTRMCSAPNGSWSPAIPAPTIRCWPWSVVRSTACADCRGAR